MNYINYLLIFIAITGILGCSKKNTSSSSYEKIIYGSGGGFTGMVKSYSIDKDGSVFSVEKQEKLTTLSAKAKKQVFTQASNEGISEVSFNNPGNFYHFLEVETDGKTNRIVWSDQNKAPDKVLEFYQYLIDLTKPFIK